MGKGSSEKGNLGVVENGGVRCGCKVWVEGEGWVGAVPLFFLDGKSG